MRALIFVVTAVSGLLASFPAAGYQLEIEALGRRIGERRLVLPDGRQLPATRVSVGTSTATGARGRAGEVLVEGVAVTATVSFGPVPATVESIQILELRLHGDDAEFRDVPIDRP